MLKQKNFTKQMQNGLSHSGKKWSHISNLPSFILDTPSSLYCIMLRGTRSKYIQYKIKKVSCNPPATFIHFVLLGHPIPVCESINHFCTSNRALFMITRARSLWKIEKTGRGESPEIWARVLVGFIFPCRGSFATSDESYLPESLSETRDADLVVMRWG